MAENATLFIVGVIAIISGAAMIYFFGVDGWRALTAVNMDGARVFKDCILFFLGGVFLGIGIKQIHD